VFLNLDIIERGIRPGAKKHGEARLSRREQKMGKKGDKKNPTLSPGVGTKRGLPQRTSLSMF